MESLKVRLAEATLAHAVDLIAHGRSLPVPRIPSPRDHPINAKWLLSEPVPQIETQLLRCSSCHNRVLSLIGRLCQDCYIQSCRRETMRNLRKRSFHIELANRRTMGFIPARESRVSP